MPHNDILAKLKDAVRSVSDNIQNYYNVFELAGLYNLRYC